MRTPGQQLTKSRAFKNISHGYSSYDLQRLAGLGRVSASLLHEISNPLASAMLYIEEYADKNAPAIKEARRNIRRVYKYVEAARQQARRESRPADFSLYGQFSQIKQLVVPLAKKAGARLEIGELPRCKLHGDPVKFQQVVANLIVNAIESYERDPPLDSERLVKIDVGIRGRHVEIKVHDWGCGIAAPNLRRIFEPFFTTKNMSGKGLGIGLAIVQQYVAEDFRGSLEVKSRHGLGTVFSVKLPYKPRAM